MADTEDTTTDAVASAATSTTQSATQETADDFDKDRAMATIKQLRAFEKDAKAKIKRLQEIEAAEEERKSADLSELEKTRKALEKLQVEHATAQTQLARARIKDAAQATATAQGMTFAPGALDDALDLGKFADLTIGDDGRVKGMTDHLRLLQKERPHYFVTIKAEPKDIGALERGKESSTPDPGKLAQRFGIRLG